MTGETSWADRPSELHRGDWKAAALRVKDGVTEDRLSLIAAGVAFFGLLAIFPAITALMAIDQTAAGRALALEAALARGL